MGINSPRACSEPSEGAESGILVKPVYSPPGNYLIIMR